MKLRVVEKNAMIAYAKQHKRTKKEEWFARYFSNIPQGWKEEDEDE